MSEAARLGVPKTTLLHMVYNMRVETLVGAIPLIEKIFHRLEGECKKHCFDLHELAWTRNFKFEKIRDRNENSSNSP